MPEISKEAAIAKSEEVTGATHVTDKEPTLVYYASSDDNVLLTYAVQVRNRQMGTYYEVLINAHNAERSPGWIVSPGLQ